MTALSSSPSEPFYWRRCPPRNPLKELYPPDVVVHCPEGDDIKLFKATRVREFEANDPELRDLRKMIAEDIRADRRQKRAERQAKREREEHLRRRLAEQIRVNIDDLPHLEETDPTSAA